MRNRMTAGLMAAGLVVAAATPAVAQEADWPNSGPLNDGGTFQLAPRIAEKLANGEPINYVFSYQSPNIPLFSNQYQAGYETTLPQAQEILPALTGQIIAPVSPTGIDVPGQIAQIEALLNTDSIDCLSIEPPDSNAFTQITNQVIAAGIPVFTVGVTSNGNELTNFTQVPELEGAQAANILLDWMAETGNELKTFAVSGGDPTSFWGQGRMRSFRETIQAAIPDAVFVNTEENALSTTFEEGPTYDAYMALIAGQPDLDFIQNVDIGAEHAARAIRDSGKEGEIFTLGWNVSYGQLDAIDQGIQVVALDQKWAEQAGFGALACADFLANGIVRPNTQELFPVTAANTADARAELDAVLGGGE
jgi:ABC-type sugar transport system substrate-binding protein